MSEVQRFGVWDYVVFAAMLTASASIGIYSAFSGGRQRTADEVLLGNRRLNPIPVGLSIMASSISAIAIIGIPGEVYAYDTMFSWIIVSYIPANILIAVLFMPIYFQLKITSVNEYLELRFSKGLRLFGTVVFLFSSAFYMAIVLYTPGIAINAVTGMDPWLCIALTGLVATFYTTLGGMKAVVWTDTLQSVVMIAGVVAVIIKGSIDVGGVGEVWRRGVEGTRIEFLETTADPRVVYSVWSVLVGQTFQNMRLGVNQTGVQRYISCGSRRKATIALVVSAFAYAVIVTLCITAGVVMYAYYAGCDPITSGKVTRADQIMPLLVMDLYGAYPGLPGLFLAAVAGGSLSTVSSVTNAMAAVTGEDIVKSIFPNIAPKTYTWTIKGLALFYGLLGIGMAAGVAYLGQSVLQLSLSLSGVTGGGIMALFLLGIYFYRCNSKGASAGLLVSVLFIGWLKVGSILYPASFRGQGPVNIDQCPNDVMPILVSNATTDMMRSTLPPSPSDTSFSVLNLYQLSFMYYTPIGLAITVVVGILVSGITGFNRPSDVDDHLKNNLTDALCCCLPESTKERMRLGAEKSNVKMEPNDKDYDKGNDVVKIQPTETTHL